MKTPSNGDSGKPNCAPSLNRAAHGRTLELLFLLLDHRAPGLEVHKAGGGEKSKSTEWAKEGWPLRACCLSAALPSAADLGYEVEKNHDCKSREKIPLLHEIGPFNLKIQNIL